MSETTVPNDPWGRVNKDISQQVPSAKEVNEYHTNSDRDASINALHHTLGTRRNQAAKGDHIHNGENGQKVGDGMALNVTGAKGGNAALTSLLAMLAKVIDFTDTTT